MDHKLSRWWGNTKNGQAGPASKRLRVAMFTPLPPARTGTADYAASLAAALAARVELTVFERPPSTLAEGRFDVLLYQIANNPHHAAIYEFALSHPGVVVLHEATLHHLIQGLTGYGSGGDAYLREVTYEIFGRRQDGLEEREAIRQVPRSDQFRMLRKLLDRSTGCITHSAHARAEVLRKGYSGPMATIPHGADTVTADTRASRQELQLGHAGLVIGVMGYQRPSKRAISCLRIFRRVLRAAPDAKLLIVGEPHPEVSLAAEIASLGISENVRILPFQRDAAAFDRAIAACDVILNLRHPAYSETSGTMMRAFGMGKAVVVSDNGANSELPAGICVKIPCDSYEEEVAVACLEWLAARPAAVRQVGEAARQWVTRTCLWPMVAENYADFLQDVTARRNGRSDAMEADTAPRSARELTRYCSSWTEEGSAAEAYFAEHAARLARTLQLTPAGAPGARALEMGCYLQITPALQNCLHYSEVRGSYLGRSGQVDEKEIHNRSGERFRCAIDLFNAETDRFPYPDEHFSLVLCCELLEHLQRDPMHMMAEINRILAPGGTVVLTTPNAASLRAVTAVIDGRHPGWFTQYCWPPGDTLSDHRHEREYTPEEIIQLLIDAGFAVEKVETGPYGPQPVSPETERVAAMLGKGDRLSGLRGDCTYAVARKSGSVENRFPAWLYKGVSAEGVG